MKYVTNDIYDTLTTSVAQWVTLQALQAEVSGSIPGEINFGTRKFVVETQITRFKQGNSLVRNLVICVIVWNNYDRN